MLEAIAGHSELERVQMHPTSYVVVGQGPTETSNRRRIRYGPDLVPAGSGQQRSVTDLVLRALARLTSPDGHQDPHDLSREPLLCIVEIGLFLFKPLLAAGRMQEGIEERFD
jgi:hypothetical protein